MSNGSKPSPCARALFYLSQDHVHVGNVAVLQFLEFFVRDGTSRVFAPLHASLMLTANLNARVLGLL